VHASPGQPRRIQVAATEIVAEHVGPLVDAFAGRDVGVEIAVEAVPGDSFAECLEHRRADIAFGPRPASEQAATIATVPFLRCRLIVVATPGHPLARCHAVPVSALAGERWLIGPPDLDRTEGAGLFFERARLEQPETVAYTSHAAALAAAAAGEGIAVTFVHSVANELHRRSLVRLDVRGTPLNELWHASTLGLGRTLPAALALQRFATTPEATQAMSTGRVGATSARSRPTVHVTLWRSIAGERAAAGRR